MIEREVWLVYIDMPKELMNDIREGSIDLADQTIDLGELDNAYEDDLDKAGTEEGEENQPQQDQGVGMAPAMGMGGPQAAPGGMM
jgi:hypothetical protein